VVDVVQRLLPVVREGTRHVPRAGVVGGNQVSFAAERAANRVGTV
jgi:hypothetical protein